MKTKIKVSSIILSCALFASCSIPSYPFKETRENLQDYSNISIESISLSDSDKVQKFNNEFLRGVDASFLADLENNGALFYSEANKEEDALKILKDSGVNVIRLRLWVEPYGALSTPSLANYGYNNLRKTAVIAKRAKNLDLQILLDFHYSDTWAHPGQQLWPQSFEDCTSIDALSKRVYDYTKDSLMYLKNYGALPEYVQIGNEIDSGMFLTSSSNGSATVTCPNGSANLKSVLNNAYAAVKEVGPDTEVIIHIANPDNVTRITNFAGLNYDALGISYYPCDSNRSLSKLETAVSTILSKGKKAYILETSFPYTCEWVENKNDTMNNNVWYTGASSCETAYSNLSVKEADWNLATEVYESVNILSATPENQAMVMRGLVEECAVTGVSGIFYWGGEWVSQTSIPSSWENQALFDLDGKVLPAVKALGVKAE